MGYIIYPKQNTTKHQFVSIRPAKEGTSLATRHAAAVVSWHVTGCEIWDPGMLDSPKKFSLGGSLCSKIDSALSYIYIYVCAIWPSIASITHGSWSSSGYWGIKIGSSDSGDPRSQFFSSTVTRNRPWKYLMDPQDVTPRLARKPHTYLISSTPQKLFGHSPNPRYLRAKGSGFVWN